ncbi:MAG TPA: hypothetical protein VMR70_07405 [Flavisolibacter sp.]|nr:hypothetical protein [Flavisolibacter sp.]
MEEKKNTQPENQQAGENPTLNEPGARVPDYGSPTGGASTENEQGNTGQRSENNRGTEGSNETLGNP